jgi:hypothetical protein
MSKSVIRKEVDADAGKFADLYRDMRGQFTKAKGKLHKVVLRHVRMGSKGDGGGDADVSQWDAEHFEGKDPNDFTGEVITDIMEDVRIFPPTVQRYGVFFWHKDTTNYQHRLFVTVQGGGPGESGDVFGSESVDNEGRMSQIMRHDEGYTRLALQALHNTLNSKDKQIDQLAQMNQGLMQQLIPVIMTVQDVLDRTAERDFNLERKKKLFALLDQGGEMAMKVGPFIAANLLKEKSPDMSAMILKAVTNPANDILKLFMAEIEKNPDKAGPIFQAVQGLPNGQAILQALANLDAQNKAEAAKEAEKAAKKRRETEANANGTPQQKE